jgi:hypothetical protein
MGEWACEFEHPPITASGLPNALCFDASGSSKTYASNGHVLPKSSVFNIAIKA